MKKGPIGLISQSGGVTTQSAYHISDEYVGFSNINTPEESIRALALLRNYWQGRDVCPDNH
ncbi:MAG: hypothetical protein U5R49_23335 [Deltaproteobacteria bacterium]|nr:hypothetical protein [Deltaproteobacteria bacterium]